MPARLCYQAACRQRSDNLPIRPHLSTQPPARFLNAGCIETHTCLCNSCGRPSCIDYHFLHGDDRPSILRPRRCAVPHGSQQVASTDCLLATRRVFSLLCQFLSTVHTSNNSNASLPYPPKRGLRILIACSMRLLQFDFLKGCFQGDRELLLFEIPPATHVKVVAALAFFSVHAHCFEYARC